MLEGDRIRPLHGPGHLPRVDCECHVTAAFRPRDFAGDAADTRYLAHRSDTHVAESCVDLHAPGIDDGRADEIQFSIQPLAGRRGSQQPVAQILLRHQAGQRQQPLGAQIIRIRVQFEQSCRSCTPVHVELRDGIVMARAQRTNPPTRQTPPIRRVRETDLAAQLIELRMRTVAERRDDVLGREIQVRARRFDTVTVRGQPECPGARIQVAEIFRQQQMPAAEIDAAGVQVDAPIERLEPAESLRMKPQSQSAPEAGRQTRAQGQRDAVRVVQQVDADLVQHHFRQGGIPPFNGHPTAANLEVTDRQVIEAQQREVAMLAAQLEL